MSSAKKDARDVTRLERRLGKAASRRDRRVLSELVARDYFATDPRGQTLNRTTALERHFEGKYEVESLATNDMHVRILPSAQVAVVTAHGTVRRVEDDTSHRICYMRVWVRRKKGWQAVAVHETLIS